MGYNKVSSTYRVLTEDGHIVKARSLQSKPEQEKWSPETLKEVVVTPWSLRRRPEEGADEVGAPPASTRPKRAYPQIGGGLALL